MSENNYVDFNDYEFIDEEGSFACTFAARGMTKDERLICCFDFDDGRMIKAMAWKNRDYFDLNKLPIGSRLTVEFFPSKSGRYYLCQVKCLKGGAGER